MFQETRKSCSFAKDRASRFVDISLSWFFLNSPAVWHVLNLRPLTCREYQ